jgi:hypothetical protein
MDQDLLIGDEPPPIIRVLGYVFMHWVLLVGDEPPPIIRVLG